MMKMCSLFVGGLLALSGYCVVNASVTKDVGGSSLESFVEEMSFVSIPAGAFMMGSPANDPERWNDEGPQHQVTISKGFGS